MPVSTTRRVPARASTRRARGSLSEDEIVDAALAVVAEAGLDGLSMPALARQLGSGVTSIYWYFRSKEELLVALAERVTATVHEQLPALAPGPWHQVVVDHLLAVRQFLEDQPRYREVLARSFTLGPAAPALLEHPEAAVALVETAGASPVVAAEAVEILAGFTRGFVVLEHRLESEHPNNDIADRLRHLEAGEYPTLGQFPDFVQAMWLDHEQCRFGLELLVAGLRAEHGL